MQGTTSIINSRPPKKQLSEQLDRLDSIIDGLVEGLPAAVAAAASEGTRLAVKDAIVEVMTNPELQGFFQNSMPSMPSTPPVETDTSRPSLWSRIKAGVAAAKSAVVSRIQATKSAVMRTYRQIVGLPITPIVVTTAAVAVTAGVVAYFAPAIGISSVVASIGGAIAALTAQAGDWFRRAARTLLATS
jgi:hypothetical protein